MEEKNKILYRILLGVTMVLLLLPMFQHVVDFPKVKKLKGAIEETRVPVFEWSKWWSGEFSNEADNYFTQSFGLRPDFVRLDNQLAYGLFGEFRAKHIVIGEQNYLFEQNYIDAYTGRDFIGENETVEKVRKLKMIEDTLKARGKDFLIVLAPGKASFYPEYIPDELGSASDSTNYIFLSKELKRQAVSHIDFNAWFMENKGKMDYPLYPKTGIHWSHYGMLLGMDSLLHRLEKNNGWDLPDVVWGEIEYVDERRRIDDDIEQALNLFSSFPNYKMAYPEIEIKNKEKDRPKMICIADSFFWEMFNMGMMEKIFNQGKFWYYFNTVYPDEFKNPTTTGDFDWDVEFANTDVFVMMATEGNLAYFPWGAENAFLEYFSNNYEFNQEQRENRIRKIIENIKSDEKWLGHVREKAKEKNISLDSMLWKDAEYMLAN